LFVGPVKNQGSCGSCWTFSTTGALEAAYAQAYEKSVSLFKQQLVDYASDFNNFGCNDGLPLQAFEYIKYNGGLDLEEAYPYTEVDGVSKYSSENAAIHVLETVNIIMGAEDELKHAVGVVRPVSVAYQVSGDFKQYTGGFYTNDSCGIDPMSDVNHAVVAVGYGEENGVPYWLIKNSWGADWGLGGYYKIEMGKNMCGVATCAYYPIIPLYAVHSVEIISMKENTSYEIVPQKEEEKEGLRVGNKENTSFTQTAAGPIELVKLLIQNQDEMIKAASIEDDGKKSWKHHRTKASTENN
nr:cysteine proteinase 3-like [Tanacetum cinerariifolium]